MRMIDKGALLSDIERTIEESGCVNHESEIMDCVRYAQEVDAVPVVRGEWRFGSNGHNITRSGDYEEWHECSACKLSAEYPSSYCPNCGAKMESEGGT